MSILRGSGGGRGKGGALKLASGGANRSKSGDVSLASGFVHSDDGVSGDLTIATGAAGSSDDAGKVHRLAASAHALVMERKWQKSLCRDMKKRSPMEKEREAVANTI